MFIVQVKYRTNGRWSYAYFNGRGKLTTEKQYAHRFNRKDNAEQFARVLTKNTKYEGRVKHVD